MKAATIERRLRRDPEYELTGEEIAILNRARTDRLEAAIARGWRREKCSCHPHGLDVAAANWALEMGGDPGAHPCMTCGGNTFYWISPGGRTALYPGGPWTRS